MVRLFASSQAPAGDYDECYPGARNDDDGVYDDMVRLALLPLAVRALGDGGEGQSKTASRYHIWTWNSTAF